MELIFATLFDSERRIAIAADRVVSFQELDDGSVVFTVETATDNITIRVKEKFDMVLRTGKPPETL